jgi:GNAT superfamily N-acetyltransferase
MSQGIRIRAARPDDLGTLVQLERAAGARFRDIGMAAVADDDPASIDELASVQVDGRAWVAADDADAPIAYLVLEVIDGNAHIGQVSVHPSHARRGIGAALLDAAGAWAVQHGLASLTLTTYAEVAWNAPYSNCLASRSWPTMS